MDDELRDLFSELLTPRELPPELRARLESLLSPQAATHDDEPEIRALAVPAGLPPGLRQRLQLILEGGGGRRWLGIPIGASAALATVATAAAAAVLAVGLAVHGGGLPSPVALSHPIFQPSPSPSLEAPARGDIHTSPLPEPSVSLSPGPVEESPVPNCCLPPRESPTVPPSPAPGTTWVPVPYAAGPPPYMGGGSAQPPSGGAACSACSAPGATPSAAPPDPARIGYVGSDPEQLAGFAAYWSEVQKRGGVGNRSIELVAVDPQHPASRLLATANLDLHPISSAQGPPAWAGSPLLETMAAGEAVIDAPGVLDISSPVERQAHLVAQHLLEDTDLRTSPVPTVAIYRVNDGVFENDVPNAVRTVLDSASSPSVTTLIVDYTPGQTTFVHADAYVLSMPASSAQTFFADAAGSVPRLGFHGIYSLFDPSLPRYAGGSVAYDAMLPLWSCDTTETDVMRQDLRARGQDISAGALHGWATAKALAIALYYNDPRTPAEMQNALMQLPQDSLVLAPFSLRTAGGQSTHERFPEATLTVFQGSAQTDCRFRTDTYP